MDIKTVKDMKALLRGFKDSDLIIAYLDPDGQPFEYSDDAISGRQGFINENEDGIYECVPNVDAGSHVLLLRIHG